MFAVDPVAKAAQPAASTDQRHAPDHDLTRRLIARLPDRLRAFMLWLLQPSSRRVRIPMGVLLICGGVFSILPLLGIWMLPLGLLLLAEDMPPLKRACNRMLVFVYRHRPNWFSAGQADQAAPSSDSRS